MDESILISIKKLLGLDENYNPFDRDIIIHINSVFSILYQLGVGPKEHAFSISDSSTTWNQFITGKNNIESVKSYIYCKVRLMFDPPTAGSAMDAMKETIRELEWRLNVTDDNTVDYEAEKRKVTDNEEVNWGD